jgi:membrane-bound serine protease (ClpP class)
MELQDQVAPPFWRKVQMAFDEAVEQSADLILIRLNTYGGQVDLADSVRTKLLKSKIPVAVWVDNNAASAGALIALAANRIYMVPSASIGAATVVNQEGTPVPDKYQSYMRATMRATAEARQRNPRLAECMVDPGLGYPGVVDSGKVLTLTSSEAFRLGISDGTASTEEEVLRLVGVRKSQVIQQKLNALDNFLQFLLNPAISGILILLMLGGIYFELQSPGIGFPLVVALSAAALYFAPLYLEGLATHWEILLFVVGLILIGLEIWIIPGFGWVGALGLAVIFLALVGSMLDNDGFALPRRENGTGGQRLMGAVLAVLIPILSLGMTFLLWGERMFTHGPLRRLVLHNPTPDTSDAEQWVGLQGTSKTRLNPVGKILIREQTLEAQSEDGWIEAQTPVTVIRKEQNRLYVRKS